MGKIGAQEEGCDDDYEEESFYADSTTYMKDTPKQVPKALQGHHPPGGRLAPTPDDFQVRMHKLLCYFLGTCSSSKVKLFKLKKGTIGARKFSSLNSKA